MGRFGQTALRSVPFIGTIILSAFAIAYTWNYVEKKKKYRIMNCDIEEPQILQFYKEVSQESKTWKNRRVPRAWENTPESDQKWPDAISLGNCSRDAVVNAFWERLVANYGCPTTITTDRGSHFECSTFEAMMNFLGCRHIRTTAYQLSSNGLVERFHRQLKASPLVRDTLKADLQSTPTELVHGCTLRLPGEFVSPPPSLPSNFASTLSQQMRHIQPTPPRGQNRPVHMHRDLATCSHVLVRCDDVRKPLQPPYSGPFKVLRRTPKHFTLDRNDRRDTVSLELLM
ncbi:uncharacterized protein DEA37_0004841 [Paragonimus westermani]|uniref:Integrase catalytic domain-containing protein n=1 Tax=Paragonimus westermani TaxID=34504 RepID=A0A5J4NA05_9TREM|nr:uncharacterized protein DEA37_0004841 [Paragonimus westermani]